MTTIAARIQDTLTAQILNGELLPGDKLDETALAAQFSVSRTPIREALRELGVRGLIEVTPRRGSIVAQISAPQLADMLDAECELEGLCARLASQRMTAAEKSALEDCHSRAKQLTGSRNEARYLALNQTFHEIISDGAHNETLANMVRDLRARLIPFLRQTQFELKEDRLARSHDEHTLIVNAILKSDSDAAYAAMRRHNARLASAIIKLLRSETKRAGRRQKVKG
jgi:DNA-binding GntR family transcriptional regulator